MMTEWAPPPKGLFVTGSDTEVGKTWVSTQILRVLGAFSSKNTGFSHSPKIASQKKGGDPLLCVRKPVASGAKLHQGKLISTDTQALAEASGEPCSHITRYTFAAPIAPNLAAQQCGIDTSLKNLIQACHTPHHCWTLIEGAGGFYSPLGSDNSLNADLAQQLGLPVLLVVGLKLGCINHTLLTLEAIHQRKLHCAGIVVNNLHNIPDTKTVKLLSQLTALPVYSMPHGQPGPAWPQWLKHYLSL